MVEKIDPAYAMEYIANIREIWSLISMLIKGYGGTLTELATELDNELDSYPVIVDVSPNRFPPGVTCLIAAPAVYYEIKPVPRN
jgi:hypothetical protein